MPLYEWVDKKTGKVFEIYKDTFDKYNEPPLDEELPEEEKGQERDWEKRIGGGIKVVRGSNWSGSKGNW